MRDYPEASAKKMIKFIDGGGFFQDVPISRIFSSPLLYAGFSPAKWAFICSSYSGAGREVH
jgi:hypothetical protein